MSTELEKCPTLCMVQKERDECACWFHAGSGEKWRGAYYPTILVLFVVVDSRADGERVGWMQ